MGKLKFKKEPIDDFASWTKQVKKDKLETFNDIYEHYRTLHDETTSLKYAAETYGKVMVAAGLAKDAKEAYSVLKYDGNEVYIPDVFMDSWVKKAKKAGIISVELHEDHVEKFILEYTRLYSTELVFALDVLVAEKAGLKVDEKEPVTFRTKLEFKKNKVVFFSEKYGSQDISYDLYYAWLNSMLSEGHIDAKTNSQMLKYAQKGKAEEPSQASLDFYSGFLKFIGNQFKDENELKKKIKKEYPEYFVAEMESLMKNELENLAKLKVEPGKKKIGRISAIGKEKTGIVVNTEKGEQYIDMDTKLYHDIYTATIENGGKVPNSYKQKLYSYFMDQAFEKYGSLKDFDEDYSEEALDKANALVPFFEYQVAVDSQAAKKIMEQEKKLKGVPKK